MIELKNIDGTVDFSCNLKGYEFPQEKDNWCWLEVAIEQSGNQCALVDPALETTDLLLIKEWFQSLARNELPRFSHLTFTEPCISFKFLASDNEIVRISIELNHELKPSFKLKQFNRESSTWSIVFNLNASDFKSVISGLETTISNFPSRVN